MTRLQNRELYILIECAKGRSLCFTEDGGDMFLSGHPREWLSDEDTMFARSLIATGLIANDPNAEHWTSANSYDITPAGRSALKEAG